MTDGRQSNRKDKTRIDDQPSSALNPEFSELLASNPAMASSIDCWRAQSFATRLHREFEISLEKGLTAGMKSRYYALFDCYEDTTYSLRRAIQEKNTANMMSSLRALIALNAPLRYMHKTAPRAVPLHLTLDPPLKRKLVSDLIIKSFQDVAGTLNARKITEYINTHELLQRIPHDTVKRHIEELLDTGHIEQEKEGYVRTNRIYKTVNLDDATLRALLGNDIYGEFEEHGFPGISNILNKKEKFRRFFEELTGSGDLVSELFLSAVDDLQSFEKQEHEIINWQHSDLIGSAIPRPYQRDAYAIFKGHGYQAPLIEAPTASGKTLVGMMAIQDWLTSLSPGETILVLVPTVNYEQQWVRELCYKDIGLHLSPDDVFAGPPSAYNQKRESAKSPPAIVVMTYTGLAQLGSPKGKGGFDRISIERFLMGSSTRYVILDEVHKVVQDMEGVSAGVTRLLLEWLEDGSLEGLIGFSGTAEAYRSRFDKLGLDLVYVLPSVDLIAYGFVAPFGEFGIPFTYSERESRIRELLNEYKTMMQEYVDIIGADNLRAAFRRIPQDTRFTIADDFLDMYSYRKDRKSALRKRFKEWSYGGDLSINEMPLVSIIQFAENLSDEALVERFTQQLSKEEQKAKKRRFVRIVNRLRRIRSDLRDIVPFTFITSRLKRRFFGHRFQSKELFESHQSFETKVALRKAVRDVLGYSIVGMYTILRSLYYRMGEGRVQIISSIIEAEQSVRDLTSVIIFAKGKEIDWETGTAEPGYSGVGGIFGHMLIESDFVPIAVLSNEMYLPWHSEYSIPHSISEYIKEGIMGDELGRTLLSILVQGLEINPEDLKKLKRKYKVALKTYLDEMGRVGALRPVEFDDSVLSGLRRLVNKMESLDAPKILNRLHLDYPHMEKWVRNFFDYALVAARFEEAEVAELRHPTGNTGKFFIVRMAQDERKQLMYDLAARIVDAEELPINLIVVSRWARTGWNVISPNLLIDATATRNVTAWQQLRGRSMRALSTWNNNCYEAMMHLLGPMLLSEQSTPAPGESPSESELVKQIDSNTIDLLTDILNDPDTLSGDIKTSISEKIHEGNLSRFTEDERKRLAAELMLTRNKVTHIYELMKAYGGSKQIRFHSRHNEWRRTQSVATKHSHNYSINPFTGEYQKGEEHAPLLYIDDPREDSPTKLGSYLSSKLKDCDSTIVDGWIRALLATKKKN